jgi:hypothetical protein
VFEYVCMNMCEGCTGPTCVLKGNTEGQDRKSVYSDDPQALKIEDLHEQENASQHCQADKGSWFWCSVVVRWWCAYWVRCGGGR